MIPASYLFKQTYNRAWNEPEIPAAAEQRHNHLRGLLTPVLSTLTALLAHRLPTRSQTFGHHAYD